MQLKIEALQTCGAAQSTLCNTAPSWSKNTFPIINIDTFPLLFHCWLGWLGHQCLLKLTWLGVRRYSSTLSNCPSVSISLWCSPKLSAPKALTVFTENSILNVFVVEECKMFSWKLCIALSLKVNLYEMPGRVQCPHGAIPGKMCVSADRIAAECVHPMRPRLY